MLLFESIHLDILIPAFINIKSLELASFLGSFNTLLSLAVVSVSTIFCYNVITTSIKLERAAINLKPDSPEFQSFLEKNSLKKWEFLKEELKPTRTFYGGILPEMMMIKDFVVAFFIVAFVEYTEVQLALTILIFSVSSFLAIKLNPYTSKILSFTKILNELVYLLVCLTFLFYYVLRNKVEESKKYAYFGNTLISIIGAGVFLNVILGLLSVVVVMVAKCRKAKDISKVHPQAEETCEPKINSDQVE